MPKNPVSQGWIQNFNPGLSDLKAHAFSTALCCQHLSQHRGAGNVDEKVRHTQKTINELERIIERDSIKQDATSAIRASEKELDLPSP